MNAAHPDSKRTASVRARGRVLAALALALLAGCAVNPNTGRSQLMPWPAAQAAEADLGYALTTKPQEPAAAAPCTAAAEDAICPSAEQRARFAQQVTRIGAELEADAREFAPDVFTRVKSFQIEVRDVRDPYTASSAGGSIALAAELAALDPTDDAIAFLIAREMGHVIARHHEEDAGARLVFSALTSLVSGASLATKIAASIAGPGALSGSWAEQQRREADELALALLARSARSARTVALNLRMGLNLGRLPAGDWKRQLEQSTERVAAIAARLEAQEQLLAQRPPAQEGSVAVATGKR